MKLTQLAQAAQTVINQNHSFLIYGGPKVGKTRLVGTAAKILEIKRIFWFDIENGVETLLHMDLTAEELDKIIVFKIPDTRDNPIAIETILKAFTSKTPGTICDAHGKWNCAECKKNNLPAQEFFYPSLTNSDLVVIDSGSALGDSALGAACFGKDQMYKPGWDEYGMVGKWLGDVLSVVQQARYCTFAIITHEVALEDEQGKDKIYPLMGTKPFSMKVGKYFGTVVYMHKHMNKHTAGSSSTYRPDVVSGSRLNIAIEKNSDKTMRELLITGGIIKPEGGLSIPANPATQVADKTPAPAPSAVSGFKARLAQRNS